jgi:hypothetical protein
LEWHDIWIVEFKQYAMKKLFFVLMGMVILSSCSTAKVEETSINESAEVKNNYQQAEIMQAIEMRRFIIKFDRLYILNGGTIDLIPNANYVIVDGDKVVISAAYIGRQYSYRPVRGVDMIGQAVSFEMKNNPSKSSYEIRMKVKNDKNTFDVYVTISDDGYCSASLVGYKIDRVRYTGNFLSLKPKVEKVEPADIML